MTNETENFIFSPTKYATLLNQILDSSYRCITFSEQLRIHLNHDSIKLCLLRHDVDISMDYALDMGRIEKQLGIRSTFFLMLRSPMYNLMSRHSKRSMEELIDLGHEIGLHFDASCTRRHNNKIEQEINFELDVLSNIAGQRVRAFSFHQPSNEIIQLKIAIPEVINTYNPDQLNDYKYISDSNRVWQKMNPYEFLSCGFERIQILIHPIWWMCNEISTQECWDQAMVRNFESLQYQLLETERAYGTKRSIKISKL
jgi:hypothetical protein